MLKIAHRGLSHFFSDNSIKAFEAAIEKKFDMIELDIQLCKTGEIVIYHDIYVNSKLILDHTLEECKNINICSLLDFFSLIFEKNKDMKIYLDLKGDYNISGSLSIFLEEYKNIINHENVYIASFKKKCITNLLEIQKKFPIKLGLISCSSFEKSDMIHILKNLSFISFDWNVLDNNIIELIHSYNIQVFTFTCENYFILTHMRKFNIDGIVTNFHWW
jgi:glycerophosphoryl diester phosphodiesterase